MSGQSLAVGLKNKVASLGQLTTDGLESFLDDAGHVINGAGASVRHRRLLVRRSVAVALAAVVRLGRIGQIRDAVVGVLKVEGSDKVTHILAAPFHHLVGGDILALGSKPLLDEENLRVMV